MFVEEVEKGLEELEGYGYIRKIWYIELSDY